MNNLKLSWFSDQVWSSFVAIKQNKYTPYIAFTSSVVTVSFYVKPTFSKVLLQCFSFLCISPIMTLRFDLKFTYYLFTRDLWLRLKRAWRELEVGQKIPDYITIVHLNQYTQALVNMLRDTNKKKDKYTCLVFGSCT